MGEPDKESLTAGHVPVNSHDHLIVIATSPRNRVEVVDGAGRGDDARTIPTSRALMALWPTPKSYTSPKMRIDCGLGPGPLTSGDH